MFSETENYERSRLSCHSQKLNRNGDVMSVVQLRRIFVNQMSFSRKHCITCTKPDGIIIIVTRRNNRRTDARACVFLNLEDVPALAPDWLTLNVTPNKTMDSLYENVTYLFYLH